MPDSATYRVPGMSCEHGKVAISEELSVIAGVDSVGVDLETKLVTLTGSALDDAALRGAIDEAGYEVE